MVNRLLEYKTDIMDVFYSEEVKTHFMEEPEIALEESLDYFAIQTSMTFSNKEPEEKELIELNSKRHNLNRIAVLWTHGETMGGNGFIFIKKINLN